MKLLFLVQYPEQAPSPRYRVYQMIPWLREQGITCEVEALVTPRQYAQLRQPGSRVRKLGWMAHSWLRRFRRVLQAGRYDAVYLLKNSFPFGYPMFESLLARSATPVILDYDDAIYLDQQSRHHRFPCGRRPRDLERRPRHRREQYQHNLLRRHQRRRR